MILYNTINKRGNIMSYFTVYKYNDNLYQIKDALGVLATLVIGEEKALLLDTCYGIGNLKKEVEKITNKPLIVVNSHGHMDHSCGNYQFDKVTSLDSKENIGIRIADIFSNFVGRFIYAIRNDKNMLEDPVIKLDDLNKNDLSTKRLISDNWFDISEEQFKIYYKAAKVFAINHQYYWTLLTGHYYDDAIMFIELLKFFYYNRNYKSFTKNPLGLRKEYFNSQVIKILEHNYTKYTPN